MRYKTAVLQEFKHHVNPDIAKQQEKYMRNQFQFFGIPTLERRKIQQPFLSKEFLPEKQEAIKIIPALWQMPQRECQYFAQEMALKYAKRPEEQDIALFEEMVSQKSWWDTVDFIAVHLIGQYFRKYPHTRFSYTEKWLASGNIWLQRSALLFQLRYKEETDIAMLQSGINLLSPSNEFFINKAIGWVLREYGKTNPKWVMDFVAKTNLSNLSKREALRHLEKNVRIGNYRV